MAPESTPALRALAQARIPFDVRTYAPNGAVERHAYGHEAAEALGVDPSRIFKTLVAVVDERFVVAVVPVATDLDLKALADAAGARRARLADPADAERLSGSVVGGISPIAMRRPTVTFVDSSAGAFDRILVSAGRRGVQVELAPGDLVRVTNASFRSIART